MSLQQEQNWSSLSSSKGVKAKRCDGADHHAHHHASRFFNLRVIGGRFHVEGPRTTPLRTHSNESEITAHYRQNKWPQRHETEIRRPICQRSKRAWLPPLWIPNWRQVLKWMDSRLKPSWRREREWVVVVEWLLVECLFHSMHSNTLFRFAKNDKNIVLRNCEYGFKS
jgi:hypothetical protein